MQLNGVKAETVIKRAKLGFFYSIELFFQYFLKNFKIGKKQKDK